MDECGEADDHSVCNSIKVEYDDFYCYKANLYEDEKGTCIPYPKKKEEQKIYWDLFNGLNKELFSSIGKYINEEINLEELESLPETRKPTQKEIEQYMSAKLKEFLEGIFIKGKKEFYDINEVVETETASLTSKDKEVFASENTCGYHMMRKFLYEQKAENITEKNTCFKVNKFDDLKDILDCGYAIFKYKIDGQNYEYRTCFLLPTTNMPKNFSMMFTDSIKTAIEEDDGFIYALLYTAAGKGENEYGNIADKKSSRRLSEMTYTVEVENKDGRKVKYSSDKANLEVIAEGTKTKPEESENGSGKNKISYLTFGLILLISIL